MFPKACGTDVEMVIDRTYCGKKISASFFYQADDSVLSAMRRFDNQGCPTRPFTRLVWFFDGLRKVEGWHVTCNWRFVEHSDSAYFRRAVMVASRCGWTFLGCLLHCKNHCLCQLGKSDYIWWMCRRNRGWGENRLKLPGSTSFVSVGERMKKEKKKLMWKTVKTT